MSLTSIRWCTLVTVDGCVVAAVTVVPGGAPVVSDRSDHAPPVIYAAKGAADGPRPAPVRGRGNGRFCARSPETIWSRYGGGAMDRRNAHLLPGVFNLRRRRSTDGGENEIAFLQSPSYRFSASKKVRPTLPRSMGTRNHTPFDRPASVLGVNSVVGGNRRGQRWHISLPVNGSKSRFNNRTCVHAVETNAFGVVLRRVRFGKRKRKNTPGRWWRANGDERYGREN